MPSQPTGDRTTEFVHLFAAHEREVFKYILTLLPDENSAQDVFQETSVTLWTKFDEFTPGTHFPAWACRVAYFEVLKFRQTRGRDRLQFDADLIERLAEDRDETNDYLESRRRALSDCLESLIPADRRLVQECYRGKGAIKELANATGRSVHTLYKSIERIRRSLMKCVDKKTGEEWRDHE